MFFVKFIVKRDSSFANVCDDNWDHDVLLHFMYHCRLANLDLFILYNVVYNGVSFDVAFCGTVDCLVSGIDEGAAFDWVFRV